MSKLIWLTIKQAAEVSQVTENTMRNWCKTGRAKGAKKIGRDWRIPDYFMQEAEGVTIEPVTEIRLIRPVKNFRDVVKNRQQAL